MGHPTALSCPEALLKGCVSQHCPAYNRTESGGVLQIDRSFVGVEKGGVTLTVSLGEKEAKAVAAEHPDAYEEIWPWRHSAPKRIVAANDKRTLQT